MSVEPEARLQRDFEAVAQLLAKILIYKGHITHEEMEQVHERSMDIVDELYAADEPDPPTPPKRPQALHLV